MKKILSLVLAGFMMLSGISVFASDISSGVFGTEYLEGAKELEFTWEITESSYWELYAYNHSEESLKIIINIGTRDIHKLEIAPKQTAEIYAEEKFNKGTYTVKAVSLGTENLCGKLSYQITNNKDNLRKKAPESLTDMSGMSYSSGESGSEAITILRPVDTQAVKPFVRFDVSPKTEIADTHILRVDYSPETKALNELSKYGIIEGDPNGDFRPYTTITRAEMAKVLCKVLGLPKTDNGKSDFSDMSPEHWAYGYIESAYASGLIDGNDDGTFAPDNAVKFSEAVKMIVTALGYKPMAEQKGGFPHGYAQIASQNGVTKDIDHALDVACNRNTVFKMLYNALDVPRMIQTGFGANAEYEIADGKNNTPYQTLRSLITGTEIIPGQKYDKDYFDELNKFMEGGEYYDKIAAELEEFWKPDGFNGTYTFEIVHAELNSDATNISLKVKITPDNGKICYVHLGYAKVDGKWQF